MKHLNYYSRPLLLTIALFSCFWSFAQVEQRHNLAIRYIAPNFISPLDVKPAGIEGGEYFGSGFEAEYQYRLLPNFLLGVPVQLSLADVIRDEDVVLDGSPLTSTGAIRNIGMVGTDLLLVFEPIARASRFDPQLFGGVGIFTEDFKRTTVEVPLGLSLNFRIGNATYISPQVSYRIGMDNDAESIRDNYRIGFGALIMLDPTPPPPPPPPPVTDSDGDGLNDDQDMCPTVAGPVALLGCPDGDGDGIADKDDACPELAGLAAFQGCPDSDGDGIPDTEDDCPQEAGTAANNGCPVRDRDGDGVPDDEDDCPDAAGTLALNGCPDGDGDGVADKDDDCPNAAGPARLNGCPDRDGDGVLDKDDRCPDEAGTLEDRGCPAIEEEDREVIEFAIQNVNFRSGSAYLSPSSRGVLDQIADIMQRYPNRNLAIGGHTDSQGSDELNLRLSKERAQRVYDYLVEKGIGTDRMTHEGYGEMQPIATNDTTAGREENRRVEFNLSVR